MSQIRRTEASSMTIYYILRSYCRFHNSNISEENKDISFFNFNYKSRIAFICNSESKQSQYTILDFN